MTKLGLAFALMAVVGCHHYGRPTPASCHAKYVRDRRGDDVDNYDNCLARAEVYRERREAHLRGEDTGRRGGGFWTGAVVGAVVGAAAARNANRPVRCYRDVDGSVYCY